MPKFTISININKPPEIVNKALLIPENAPAWTTGLEKFEVIMGSPGKTGAIGHLHYRQNGKRYILKDELIFSDPGKRYKSKVTGQGMDIDVETVLNPSNGGTELSLSWKGKTSNPIMKVIFPFIGKRIKKSAHQELTKLKSLIEKYGAVFPQE